MSNKNLEFLKDNIFAHRGYHLEKYNVPENSLKSFEKAIQKGYGI